MSCIGGLLFLFFPPKGQNRCSGERICWVESHNVCPPYRTLKDHVQQNAINCNTLKVYCVFLPQWNAGDKRCSSPCVAFQTTAYCDFLSEGNLPCCFWPQACGALSNRKTIHIKETNARAAVHTCFAQNLSVHQLSQRTLLAGRGATHLNSWCSLELRILEENLSASLSKLREYSSSISALRRKNSCRSCSSWMRDSDCCSKHLNCSTSWLRISAHWKSRREVVIMGHMTGYNAHIAGTRPECLPVWEDMRKRVLKTASCVMSWKARTSLELVLPSETP